MPHQRPREHEGHRTPKAATLTRVKTRLLREFGDSLRAVAPADAHEPGLKGRARAGRGNASAFRGVEEGVGMEG
jgi:hypothetical protein